MYDVLYGGFLYSFSCPKLIFSIPRTDRASILVIMYRLPILYLVSSVSSAVRAPKASPSSSPLQFDAYSMDLH